VRLAVSSPGTPVEYSVTTGCPMSAPNAAILRRLAIGIVWVSGGFVMCSWRATDRGPNRRRAIGFGKADSARRQMGARCGHPVPLPASSNGFQVVALGSLLIRGRQTRLGARGLPQIPPALPFPAFTSRTTRTIDSAQSPESHLRIRGGLLFHCREQVVRGIQLEEKIGDDKGRQPNYHLVSAHDPSFGTLLRRAEEESLFSERAGES